MSACTTTSSTSNKPNRFAGLSAARNINPDMVSACTHSAANKYFLPTCVIYAVRHKAVDGSTIINLKVDFRDAVCTITTDGKVRSVIDTSPKSADHRRRTDRA